MSVDPRTTALLRFLQANAPEYSAKAMELRDAVQGWLSYIPATFGHYTGHTVQHSDEMIAEMSMLLFRDGDPAKPVAELSPVEAYILVAAAYLHDAGMVVSEREKGAILESDEWKQWTSEGGGKKRWQEVQEFHESGSAPSEEVRHFLADVQTRFLIAEFVRRSHHRRAADFLDQHEAALGRFAFDDPLLRRTIADVCMSHGLSTHELEDRQRFPDRRSVRHHLANVQFLAVVLRLGDLLDMSYDRACPLLLNAASPLPPDSYAHWTQYARVTDRLTAHDVIRLKAECETQEEHRYLRDWCQWLVDEVRSAASVMAHAERHPDWRPPKASFKDTEQPDGTIDIQPSARANYFFTDWRFELDSDAVFERLIRDVHGGPMEFVRELLQNAFDASRCQMYADLRRDGETPPEYPTQVEEDRRLHYPIRVSLELREIKNELSGELEERQVLTVEDRGIGMDGHIIERYFLQVARSYYRTDEFRKQYRFVPASRFGVGFLSTFAASDSLTVETYKPSSPSQDGPLRLRLGGPRNYLLTERADRSSSGTRLEVTLRAPIKAGRLTRLVSNWCKRVEFPIIVDDLGQRTTIKADCPVTDVSPVPDARDENCRFVIRTFIIDQASIRGEFYVLAHEGPAGEAWDAARWARSGYLSEYPLGAIPELPRGYLCLHGIATPEDLLPYATRDAASLRLDVRRDVEDLSMARRLPGAVAIWNEIEALWTDVLAEHLATSPRAASDDAWLYKQALMACFPLASFWDTVPGTVPVYVEGKQVLSELQKVRQLPALCTLVGPSSAYLRRAAKVPSGVPADIRPACPVILEQDTYRLSEVSRRLIFADREPQSVEWVSPDRLAVCWAHSPPRSADEAQLIHSPIHYVRLPDRDALALAVHRTTANVWECVLVNAEQPFSEWVAEVMGATGDALAPAYTRELLEGLRTAAVTGYKGQLVKCIGTLRQIPDLPPELHPPDVPDLERAFHLRPPEDVEQPA